MDKKCILIIGDDEIILRGFKNLLESEGYEVDTAGNGGVAIEKVRNKHYNLALIDIKLPDIEGTELLPEFRQLNPVMKRIIVTGYSTRENAIDSLNRGADGYLEKPVASGKLLEFLADKLAEQERESEQYADTMNELLNSENLRTFTRSSVRMKVMLCLIESEMKTNEIEKRTGLRDTTILHTLKKLIDEKLAIGTANGYVLTNVGKIQAQIVNDLMFTISTLDRHKEFIANHDLSSIRLNFKRRLVCCINMSCLNYLILRNLYADKNT